MIRPVRHFSAFCHPDCEHRKGAECNRFNQYGSVLQIVTTAGFVNAYVRDPWCVVEETEQHGALNRVPSTLLK